MSNSQEKIITLVPYTWHWNKYNNGKAHIMEKYVYIIEIRHGKRSLPKTHDKKSISLCNMWKTITGKNTWQEIYIIVITHAKKKKKITGKNTWQEIPSLGYLDK